MLEEEYDKTRRRLPAHLRRVETERPFSYEIRPMQDGDIPDIREIYNHYVTNSVVTFDEKKWSLKQWRDKAAHLHKLGMPFLVAQSPSGQVLGYALVQPMSSKSAYRYSVENSIYLDPGFHRRGIGSVLLERLIRDCETRGFRQMIAVIGGSDHAPSIRLHERAGFGMIGVFEGSGFKFGRWIDTVFMQMRLGDGRHSLPDEHRYPGTL